MSSVGNFVYICPFLCGYGNRQRDIFIKHFATCQNKGIESNNLDDMYLSYEDECSEDDEDDNTDEIYTVRNYINHHTNLINVVRFLINTNILQQISSKPFGEIRQFILDKLFNENVHYTILDNMSNKEKYYKYMFGDLYQIFCFFFELTADEKNLLLNDLMFDISNGKYNPTPSTPPPTSASAPPPA